MEAMEQLRQAGWAKLWNSQPYVSRRTVSFFFLLGLSFYEINDV